MESLVLRPLAREEIGRVWTIDRRELIENIYRVEGGALVLRPDRFDMRGWPPGVPEQSTPLLEACLDRGGIAMGAFDGERLVGVAILDGRLIGARRDQLQLEFLHVSHDYRGRGLGVRLFEWARDVARERGARYLYVSATPSERTVGFYQARGCVLAPEPDPELFALEPEDIHFICPVEKREGVGEPGSPTPPQSTSRP